jgi:hypothetical protein
MVVEESAKEYCDEELFGGYIYGFVPTLGRGSPYARYGVDMINGFGGKKGIVKGRGRKGGW